MKLHTFPTLLLLLTCLGLQAQKSFDLGMLDERIGYLQALHSTDEAIRYYEDSVMLASGFKSEEHLAAIDSLYEIDSVLSIKIDSYLRTYGYPEKKVYGETATMTPWMILRHSPVQSIRRNHFKTLYRAYKDEDLEERRLVQFLEDEYERQFLKAFNSYRMGEQRIEELMKVLELKRI